MTIKKYDVIVIGSGHAGIEAATASARIGAQTLLLTMNESNLGELSCNPSIGGIGKGTVVREVDALDGIMGKATDLASINRKMLNASKGPAVWGPRHQIDRQLYKKAIKNLLTDYKNLEIHIGTAMEIVTDDKKQTIQGLKIDNQIFYCNSLVCTTGTFLKGKIIIGEERIEAGRINEKASTNLSDSLFSLNLPMSRLKTGTPCRLDKNTIDFSLLIEQPSEDGITPHMSYMNEDIKIEQRSCFMTYTNCDSHDIIKTNAHRIPTINGDIKFKGPRYCPSIEDKIRRFGDKERHQIFLEPEGLDSDLIYPNGISTSMPKDMQIDFIKTIKGLENAKIVQFGYAIEYDFVNPTALKSTLETKQINGLFLAGQIIGTTGYEEAAGLGIVAGTNAALKALNKDKEFILDRSTSYIGIMIDDLTSVGIDYEPYRLFTSRSEYRLTSRADNADIRLTPIGIEFGLVKEERKEKFENKYNTIQQTLSKLKELKITPYKLQKIGYDINQDGIERDGFELLASNNITFDDLKNIWPHEIQDIDIEVKNYINIEAKYHTYIIRQKEEIEDFKKNYNLKIPSDINYKDLGCLSNEVIEKLNKFKPENIHQASKVSGVTPASIIAIINYIRDRK